MIIVSLCWQKVHMTRGNWASKHAPIQKDDRPSLEGLVESGAVDLESLHPGGLLLTGELADTCGISAGTRVLDVACGTGESACYLAEQFGATVCGLDHSGDLLARAREKAEKRSLSIEFRMGDAHKLPFSESAFDVAICECTLCMLDKAAALREMVRVVRPHGHVAIHDLYWDENTPASLKHRLAANEGEQPETLDGWKQLFTLAGLVDVHIVDKSALKRRWMRDIRRQLGLSRQLAVGLFALRRWGPGGLWRIFRSERAFSSRYLGYALITGSKP